MESKSIGKTKICFSLKNDSHGWIQFKGTDLCMDVYCKKCNTHSHIDGDFIYYISCPKCKTIYELNGHIELIERNPDELDDDILIQESTEY